MCIIGEEVREELRVIGEKEVLIPINKTFLVGMRSCIDLMYAPMNLCLLICLYVAVRL